jgi:hypothetical protein
MISSMNACYGNQGDIPVVHAEGTDRLRAKFGIVAEAYLTDPTFIRTTGGYDAIQFAGGISYEIFSKKRPNRLSFYSELKLKNFSNHDSYSALYQYLKQTGTLSYQTIKITNMVRLFPGKQKWFFYNVGAVYGYRFNTKIDDVVVTDRDAKDHFEVGLAAGFGKKFSSIGLFVEPRFEFGIYTNQKSFALIIAKQF